MKIVRLGMTETSLLFLSYVSRYGNLDKEIKKHVSTIIMSMVNWLYSTSGYYDKSVKGSYFNFDVTALNQNYFKFLNHLSTSVNNCHETHVFVHEGFVSELLEVYKDSFIKHFNIKNFKILNGTQLYDRIDSIFDSMRNRKVLVISAFDGLVKSQYTSGNLYKIYENFPIIKSLDTVKFPYCFCNNGPHNNYFETLESVFEEIKTIDFDIALLGCGAYGHMLCHLIDTELKKDAIYVGGSIQSLFGILNKREKQWNNYPASEYWITEIPDEYKPSNHNMVENGCYW
jgi:hypothetical protein